MERSQVSKPLLILGAGGNVYDLLDTIEAVNAVEPTWSVRGILDDRRVIDSRYLGLPVVGRLVDAQAHADCFFASTIWNESTFRELHIILSKTGLQPSRFATIIHPKASVSSRAKLGDGVLVHYGASIGGNVVIGEHVSIGPGAIIGHDTVFTGHTVVAAGAVVSGSVQVGGNCYIGSGSMIRQRINVGNQSLIGLGAVVVKDVPAHSTVAGNPARPLRRAT